jgi:hypothetical protein
MLPDLHTHRRQILKRVQICGLSNAEAILMMDT